MLSGTGIDEVSGIVTPAASGNPHIETTLTDALGSIVQGIGLQGQVLQTLIYDAYGNVMSNGGAPLTQQPFSFTGREFDASTGLYYLRSRYYDPGVGRFISEDPLFSVNRYPYVGDNPVNAIDPFGLKIIFMGSPAEISKLEAIKGQLFLSPTGSDLYGALDQLPQIIKVGINNDLGENIFGTTLSNLDVNGKFLGSDSFINLRAINEIIKDHNTDPLRQYAGALARSSWIEKCGKPCPA